MKKNTSTMKIYDVQQILYYNYVKENYIIYMYALLRGLAFG